MVARGGEESQKTRKRGEIQINLLLVHEPGNWGVLPAHPTAEISDPS